MRLELEALGWKRGRSDENDDGLALGRVAVEHKERWTVYCESGEIVAEISGKLRRAAERREGRPDDDCPDWPTVGDWVRLDVIGGSDRGVIREILPRDSAIRRKQAGRSSSAQALAANVDRAFLIHGLDADFNPRRLDRYLSLAFGAKVEPVVVLTKADLFEQAEIDRSVKTIVARAPGVPCHAISAKEGTGVEALASFFDGHRTIVLLGSSGSGKSTLINRLLGRDVQRTQELSEIGKGRHTTTHRELLVLPRPEGGLVIDTPGLRELALFDDEGLEAAFADVDSRAAACRFRDCRHENEPGCAVRDAIERGLLDPDRLVSWSKLERETRRQEMETDARARAEQNREWKVIHKAQKQFHKNRGRF